MTIKEYAASRGITYEAAGQVIKRHREELARLRRENDALKNQVIALQGQLLEERAGAAALAGRVEALEAAALPAPEAEAPRKWWQKLFGG